MMIKYSIINPYELIVTNEFNSFDELQDYLIKYRFSSIEFVSNSVMNVGGHLWDKRNNPNDYRCVYVCIRETNREIKPVHGKLFQQTWCLKRKEWTNGLYTTVVLLCKNNASNKYKARINVFRKADELTNFDENNPRDILYVTRGRSIGYDTIKEAEARFGELEKVAIRYLKMYTI